MAPVTPKNAKIPKTPRAATSRQTCYFTKSLPEKLARDSRLLSNNGAEENVFNSIGNLEKVSLALSLQAKNSHQSRLTDYFTPK